MTIIAGFKCKDGIVICADTQETLQHSKRSVPKVRFEAASPCLSEEGTISPGSDFAAAFCGAGHGPFIDKIVDRCWSASRHAETLEEACCLIESEIKNTYHEFSSIYQPGLCPEVELIYGAKMHGESRLFTAIGPIVNEKEGYDSGGSGNYMADFIAKRMHSYGLTIRQCVVLAAYVLAQAKEHVNGCGGESHIAVLQEHDQSGLVEPRRITAMTDLLENADRSLGRILIEASDLYGSTDEFLKESIEELRLLSTHRQYKREELEKGEAWFDRLFRSTDLGRDSLGFLIPRKPAIDEEKS